MGRRSNSRDRVLILEARLQILRERIKQASHLHFFLALFTKPNVAFSWQSISFVGLKAADQFREAPFVCLAGRAIAIRLNPFRMLNA
jgi:hypothetical protein